MAPIRRLLVAETLVRLLQCVAVCCGVLQCVADVAMCCNVLLCISHSLPACC